MVVEVDETPLLFTVVVLVSTVAQHELGIDFWQKASVLVEEQLTVLYSKVA